MTPLLEYSQEEILDKIRHDNPWWETNELPARYADWKPRAYLDLFHPLVAEMDVTRAVVLMGARRTGKTVMLHPSVPPPG